MVSFLAKVKISDFGRKPWFDFWESKKSYEKSIPSERASKGEQNGTNFSFIAPSSEEL